MLSSIALATLNQFDIHSFWCPLSKGFIVLNIFLKWFLKRQIFFNYQYIQNLFFFSKKVHTLLLRSTLYNCTQKYASVVPHPPLKRMYFMDVPLANECIRYTKQPVRSTSWSFFCWSPLSRYTFKNFLFHIMPSLWCMKSYGRYFFRFSPILQFNWRRIFMGVYTPFTIFFDFRLRSLRYENDFLPVLSKLSQTSMVKIFHFSDEWKVVSVAPQRGGVHPP